MLLLLLFARIGNLPQVASLLQHAQADQHCWVCQKQKHNKEEHQPLTVADETAQGGFISAATRQLPEHVEKRILTCRYFS